MSWIAHKTADAREASEGSEVCGESGRRGPVEICARASKRNVARVSRHATPRQGQAAEDCDAVFLLRARTQTGDGDGDGLWERDRGDVRCRRAGTFDLLRGCEIQPAGAGTALDGQKDAKVLRIARATEAPLEEAHPAATACSKPPLSRGETAAEKQPNRCEAQPLDVNRGARRGESCDVLGTANETVRHTGRRKAWVSWCAKRPIGGLLVGFGRA